jgi:hypothetical protein
MIIHNYEGGEMFIEHDEAGETFFRFEIQTGDFTNEVLRYTLDIFSTNGKSVYLWNLDDIKKLHTFLDEMLKKERVAK